MNNPVGIHVSAFVGGPFAVAAEDGQMLYKRIAPRLRAGAPVALSFAGIEVLGGAFLAASIGAFCANFSETELTRLLTVRDISAHDQASLNLCMKNARRYYANRDDYDAAWVAETGEDCLLQEATKP